MNSLNRSRIGYLDGLRGVAILSVVLFHAYTRWGSIETFNQLEILKTLFSYGWLGVHLFFSISGYVIYMSLKKSENILPSEISNYVSNKIGKVARPKFIFQLSDLPKTRTGKIMRRLLKSKLLGNELGDLSSLENPRILDEIEKLG